MGGTTINSKLICAAKEQVYNAFIDPKALEYWLAPNGMTGKIHEFDLRVGGGYHMSLFYLDKEIAGKTSENEDRSETTFVELKPYEKIITEIRFQSDKDVFKEKMMMEVLLESPEINLTNVIIVFKNIPSGIDPKDNEAGTEESLEKLAAYLKHAN